MPEALPFGRALVMCLTEPPDAAGGAVERVVRAGGGDELLDRASRHRVSPFVRAAVGRITDPPDALARRMRDDEIVETALAMRIAADVETLAAALDSAGVRWLILKGPALAELAYRDPTQRTYLDVDVLVARADFRRTVETLESLGSELLDRNWSLINRERRGQLHLRLPLGTLADVHWDLLNRGAVRRSVAVVTDEVFERSRPLAAGGVDARTLGATDTLLHTCLHAAVSGGDRLAWLNDVRGLVAMDAPDWPVVLERARAWRIAPLVGVILARSTRTLGAAVPEHVLDALFGVRIARSVTDVLDRRWPPEDAAGQVTPAIVWVETIRQGWAPTLAAASYRAVRYLSTLRRGDDSDDPAPPVETPSGGPVDRERFLDAVARGAVR